MAEASDCINRTFELSAALLDVDSSGLLAALMSEQRKLGEILLDKEAGLIMGEHVSVGELEEIWKGIQENEHGSADLDWDKINDSIQNAVDSIELYEAVKWYNAFVMEYGWLFEVIENDDAKIIRKQYRRILLILEDGGKFMDVYDRVCRYVEVYNR